MQSLHAKIRVAVAWLQKFVDRIWYPPFIGLLASLDNFIMIVPTDGLTISSSMLTPKRWFVIGTSVAVGSTLGAVALAMAVEQLGLPWILEIYPGIVESTSWTLTVEFFKKWGLYLVFLVAATPLVQQPAVILASLAHTPLYKLTLVVFSGRLLKFLIMAYIGSHAPRLLNKIWGVKSELQDAGVKID